MSAMAGQTISSSFRRWQVILATCTLCHIIIQGLMPELERRLYWGEAFVLLTSFSVFLIPFNCFGYQRHILLLVATWLLLFPFYGLLISLLFWSNEFLFPFFLRHMSFFYYSVFFFFAFQFGPTIVYFLRKYSPFTLLIPILLFVIGNYVGAPLSLLGFMLIGLSGQQGGKSYLYYLGLAITIGIPVVFHTTGTNKFVLAFYVGCLGSFYFARFCKKIIPPLARKIFVYGLVLIALILSIRFVHGFYKLTTHLTLMGETLNVLNEMSQETQTDLSGFWRLVLWSHLYGRLLDHPWGIGLGTPLFENWLDGFVLLHLYKFQENYIQGAHNSFVTFIARLGIPALLLFSFLFFYVAKMTKEAFRKLHFNPFKTAEGRLLLATLFTFGPSFLDANFNVKLESPLFAGIFWFTFGIFIRITGDSLAPDPVESSKNNCLTFPHVFHNASQHDGAKL